MSHQPIETSENPVAPLVEDHSPVVVQSRSGHVMGAKQPALLQPWRGAERIMGFFLLVLILVYLFDRLVDSGLRRIETSGFGVSNKIMDGKVNADILISGSSRALTHYDPRIIQEKSGRTTFNIGLNGSQTDMQLARLKAYLRHNSKPALLIHNLDLFSFQTTHGGVYDPAQYLPYLSEPAIYEALLRINPETWKSKYLPLYGYAVEDLRFTWVQGLRAWFGYNPNEDHFLGFKPRKLSWTGDFDHFKDLHPGGVRFEIEPDGVREMESMLELCASHGIAVILVYSPEYSKMQAMTSNRAEVFSRFEELGRQFGVQIWDYSGSPISSSQEYFYNSQHLNAEGADIFSRELADRLTSDLDIGRFYEARTETTK